MHLKIPNPFIRNVSVRYWHAEAVAKKRCKGYMDRRLFYFDGATQDDAAKGLRNLLLVQSAVPIHFSHSVEKYSSFPIPIWHIAYWFPKYREAYMKKRGFFRANTN